MAKKQQDQALIDEINALRLLHNETNESFEMLKEQYKEVVKSYDELLGEKNTLEIWFAIFLCAVYIITLWSLIR